MRTAVHLWRTQGVYPAQSLVQASAFSGNTIFMKLSLKSIHQLLFNHYWRSLNCCLKLPSIDPMLNLVWRSVRSSILIKYWPETALYYQPQSKAEINTCTCPIGLTQQNSNLLTVKCTALELIWSLLFLKGRTCFWRNRSFVLKERWHWYRWDSNSTACVITACEHWEVHRTPKL